MADDIAVLGIKVDSRQVKTADKDLDKLAKTSTKTAKATDGLTGSSKKATDSLSLQSKTTVTSTKATDALGAATKTTSMATTGMTRAIKGATAAILTYIGARAAGALKQYADDFTSIENRLKQVTNSTKELNDVTAKLFEVSRRTRSGITDTTTLFQRLSLASDDLGLSQTELIRITETINKSFAVSGATAAETAGAVRQLAQGLAAGALRGDEFNSVAEQAPEIMRAISKETGLAIGALREFAATGGITAEIVVNALQGIEDEIDVKFSQSIATFEQKTVLATNSLIEFAGRSEGLRAAVSVAGDTLVLGAEALAFFLENLGLITALIVARSVPAIASLAFTYGTATTAAGFLTIATRGLSAAMALLGGPFGLAAVAAVALFTYLSAADEAESSTDRLAKRTAELNRELADLGTLKQLTDRSQSVREELFKTQQVIDELQKKNDAIDIYGGIGPFEDQLVTLRNKAELLVTELKLVDDKLEDVFVRKLDDQLKGARELGSGTGELTKAITGVIAKLKEENTLLRLTTRAASLYVRLTKAGVSATSDFGKQIKKLNDQLFDEKDRIEAVAKAQRDQAEAARELIQEQKEAAREQERQAKKATKASEKAAEQLRKQWTDTRDIVAGVFVDMVEGGGNAFDILLNAFKSMLVRMVAIAAANKVLIAVGFAGAAGGAAADGGVGTDDLISAGSKLFDTQSALSSFAGTPAGQAIADAGGAIPLLSGLGGAISGFGQSGLKGGVAGGAGGFFGAKAGAALGSALLPGIGTIIGSALGGLLGGSLGAGLFGGKFEKQSVGIEFSVGDAGLIAQAFENQVSKSGLFGGGASRTFREDLDPATLQAFSGVFEATTQAVIDGFELLGRDIGQERIDPFRKTSFQVNLGEDEVANAQAIADFFGTVGQQLVDIIGGSSITFGRMVELSGALKSVNGVLGQLNTTLFESSIEGAEAAERLIAAAGGVEALSVASQTFFNLFVETRTAFEVLSDDLGVIVESIGESLPGTRQGFTDLVQGLDKTTESGQEAFVTLINLASQANDYYSELERLEAERAQSLVSVSMTALNQVRLTNAIERARITAAFDIDLANIESRITDTKSTIKTLTQISSSLDRAIDSLSDDRLESRIGVRETAQATLASAIATARSGGSIADLNLNDAINEVAKPSEDLFGSFTDYLRDFQIANNALAALKQASGDQLSIEERTLIVLEEEKTILKEGFEAQIRILTAQLQSISGGTVNVVQGVPIQPPAFAHGGSHSGGVRMVGERGPELEFTGPSRIMSNADIMSSMNNADVKAELKQLRADLNSGMFAVARNTMQTAKLLDRWDGDGLPAERTV